MTRTLLLSTALLATACLEAVAAEPTEEAQAAATLQTWTFTATQIYPQQSGIGPWYCPWCDDITCGSCNALTADHGHTCASCPSGASDCNCAVGAPPWTHPITGIVYTNRWYPKVKKR